MIPHLLAAGLTHLSMAPTQIGGAKRAIRGVGKAAAP
jgi:phosphoenolpyruvate-protein kinase (PTS system EI component)